ncbi:putative histidinol-phosphatase [Desulfosarcina widdelii]|uniref:Histidinol-phosphatase n=1 Tax=Desulfosarcina widdelii TaxID=947919 RepID=A0A5K7Z1N0_9BACT|nr:histidinol-phosphatase [Desulfosarcina widdelii]BBO74149.1 putative histidinol-phosphatase [Desulfosarcina widdelii]
MTNVPSPVSVHGGHSGQFCCHANNSLEEIVRAYIDLGYPWVGITEHMPPASDAYLYPEEKQAGLDADALMERFAEYMTVCRSLQAKYVDRIEILVGFETEYYEGSIDLARRLIGQFSPDYVVGSVHHVQEIPFDYSPKKYREAADRCGGLDELYNAYFDQQFEMLQALKPNVVGHLDLIRIYDPGYSTRLVKPNIWGKILRNLELVRQLGLILDFNLRPLSKGEKEPYLSAPILKQAIDMGIDVVPGDDSHGVDTIGRYMPTAIEMLQAAGARTNWRRPADRS